MIAAVQAVAACIVMRLAAAAMDQTAQKQLAAFVEKYAPGSAAPNCCFQFAPGIESHLRGFSEEEVGRIGVAGTYKAMPDHFEMGLIARFPPDQKATNRDIFPADIAKPDLKEAVTLRATALIEGTLEHWNIKEIRMSDAAVEVNGKSVAQSPFSKYYTFLYSATTKLEAVFLKTLNQPKESDTWKTVLPLVAKLALKTTASPPNYERKYFVDKDSVPELKAFAYHWSGMLMDSNAGITFYTNKDLKGFEKTGQIKIRGGSIEGTSFTMRLIAEFKADEKADARQLFPASVKSMAKGAVLKAEASAIVSDKIGTLSVKFDEKKPVELFFGDAPFTFAPREGGEFNHLKSTAGKAAAKALLEVMSQSTAGEAWRGFK